MVPIQSNETCWSICQNISILLVYVLAALPLTEDLQHAGPDRHMGNIKNGAVLLSNFAQLDSLP